MTGLSFKADAGHPQETPWMWTIVFHERKPPGPHQGFAAGREQAMAAFQGELGARALVSIVTYSTPRR